MNVLDDILKDIIEIFNLENVVELVRLSGLTLREKKIDYNITPQLLNKIIMHLNKREIIHYSKIVYCPHCKEIFYLIKDIENNNDKICDTCGMKFNINTLNTLHTENDVDKVIDINTLNINEKRR